MKTHQESMRSLAEKARFLMRPNASRDAFDLHQTAQVLHITPAKLDLWLWRTNGGLTAQGLRDRTSDERRVRCELKRAAREWAALQARSA